MSGAAACTSCMVLQLYDWLLWLRNLIVCVAFQEDNCIGGFGSVMNTNVSRLVFIGLTFTQLIGVSLSQSQNKCLS